jgi:hypothetical protein
MPRSRLPTSGRPPIADPIHQSRARAQIALNDDGQASAVGCARTVSGAGGWSRECPAACSSGWLFERTDRLPVLGCGVARNRIGHSTLFRFSNSSASRAFAKTSAMWAPSFSWSCGLRPRCSSRTSQPPGMPPSLGRVVHQEGVRRVWVGRFRHDPHMRHRDLQVRRSLRTARRRTGCTTCGTA